MNEGLEIFSARLKKLRTQKGITQSEIAEIFHYHLRKYQRIENGEVNVYVLTLSKLADYFGVTTDYLLGRSDVHLLMAGWKLQHWGYNNTGFHLS